MMDGEEDPPPVAQWVGFEMRGIRDGTATVVLEASRRHADPILHPNQWKRRKGAGNRGGAEA